MIRGEIIVNFPHIFTEPDNQLHRCGNKIIHIVHSEGKITHAMIPQIQNEAVTLHDIPFLTLRTHFPMIHFGKIFFCLPQIICLCFHTLPILSASYGIIANAQAVANRHSGRFQSEIPKTAVVLEAQFCLVLN